MGWSSTRILEIVEAIYRDEKSERAWLNGILDAAKPSLDRGCGLVGFPFEATPSGLNVPWLKVLGASRNIGAKLIGPVFTTRSEDAKISSVYRSVVCGTGSEVGLNMHPGWHALTRKGIPDFLALNGVDSGGRGVLIGALLSRVTTVAPRIRQQLERVAAHLGVGHRHRRVLATVGRATDAVFEPHGRLLHAEREAMMPRARSALMRAVVAIDRARGPQRRRDPEGALASWRGLVEARWSLVDEFESDGKRFVVARANEPFAVPISALSKRERQIVGYIVAGHTTKLVAYELGIADSTVRVLLGRAMNRLGVSDRDALAARYLAACGHAGSRAGAET